MLLRSLAYEEMLRHGEAPHAAEAASALRETAQAVADEPDLEAYFEEKARCLEAAATGRVAEPWPEADAYPVAMALLGRGAATRDIEALAGAAALLETLGTDDFREEVDLVGRWRAHLADPGRTARPPLPFDGMP